MDGEASRLTVTYVPVEQLSVAEYNPRTLTQDKFEDLQRSIDELALLEPLVVNRRDGRLVVVSGNQRFLAAKALGWAEVPCNIIEVPLKREQVINVRMNRSSGEDNADELAAILHALDEEELELSGYDMAELDKLQDGWATTADDLPSEEEEQPSKVKSQKWTLEELEGRARVFLASNNTDRVANFMSWLRDQE